jgi:ADP-heptose:LPS heptosyltransferase
MRLVDAWLGLPACVLLTAMRKLAAPFWRRQARPVKRILLVKLAEQGSTVLADAAMRRAVERVGEGNVYFLVFEQNRGILDAMGVIPEENVVAIRANSILGALFSTLAALRRVRRLRIDAAIDLEFFARSTAILSFLSGAPIRVGLHAYTGDGPWRGDLMTHRIGYSPHVHTSQLFRAQVDAVDQPAERFPAFDYRPPEIHELPRGQFAPNPAEVDQVRAVVREVTAIDSPRLVLLNANCSDLLPLRKWNLENYVQLARRLLEHDQDLRIAFTGAPAEAAPVERLVEAIGSNRCVSMAGRTTMRQLLVLYGLAELLITNDSGPAHFASLTPIDVITLFGPETPRLFGVLSERSHVVWARTACSPCVSAYNNRVSKCMDNVCMQRITVDEVFAKAVEVLAARAERPIEIPRPAPRTPAARLQASPD